MKEASQDRCRIRGSAPPLPHGQGPGRCGCARHCAYAPGHGSRLHSRLVDWRRRLLVIVGVAGCRATSGQRKHDCSARIRMGGSGERFPRLTAHDGNERTWTGKHGGERTIHDHRRAGINTSGIISSFMIILVGLTATLLIGTVRPASAAAAELIPGSPHGHTPELRLPTPPRLSTPTVGATPTPTPTPSTADNLRISVQALAPQVQPVGALAMRSGSRWRVRRTARRRSPSRRNRANWHRDSRSAHQPAGRPARSPYRGQPVELQAAVAVPEERRGHPYHPHGSRDSHPAAASVPPRAAS